MRFGSMFITAVCVLFLLKLRWPRKKSVYDLVNFSPEAFNTVTLQLHFRFELLMEVNGQSLLFIIRILALSETLWNERSNFRIPGHFIYMCRCALKNEVSSNSCYSYSMRC